LVLRLPFGSRVLIVTPTPLPISIPDVVHTVSNPDAGSVVIQILLVAATALLAGFTASLFRATRDVAVKTGELASDTVDASHWADRHHQEQFSQIVVWEISRCEYMRARGSGNSTTREILIEGALRNVGGGPALNIKAFLEMPPFKSDENHPMRLGLLAAGESRTNFMFWLRDDPNLTAFLDADRSTGPFTVKIWSWSQFGALIESRMVCKDTALGVTAEFDPTKIQKRSLPPG